MLNETTSKYIGWTLSFILYFFILFIAVLFLQQHNQKVEKYTASKKNLLNVTLVERKKTIPQKQKVVKEQTTVSKPETPKPQPKTVRVEKQEETKSLQGLFDNIDLSKLPKQAAKQEKKIRKKVIKDEFQEVTQVKKASKVIETLKFEEQDNLIITQKDGVYDEFKGKISDILDSHWQETIDTVSGNEAVVIIGVNKFGNFSYTIESLSYNDDFNSKLRDFLESMKDVEFPAYLGGEIFHMKVVFKDILE